MINAIGKTLQNGKYVIEYELGEGGFGLTYKATNQILNNVIVIKTLNASLQQDSNLVQLIQQFQDEAKRLAKFSHPNIVRVNDFFIEDGLPYIVMDYVPGETLDKIVLPSNPLPEITALDYIRQIAEALKVVHQNGLLHRDVKPQNIILRSGTEQVVLIDFGIAREFSPGVVQTHTRIISEGYAPIEQYVPKTQRTPATDIYALAATLYTLLTGCVPITSTLRDRFPLPSPKELIPELSEAVSRAVMKGMAIEPEQRPQSIDEWLAFFPYFSGKNINYSKKSVGFISSTSNYAKIANSAVISSDKWSIRGLIAIAAVIIGLGYAWAQVEPKFKAPITQPNDEESQTPIESITPATPEANQSVPEIQTPPIAPVTSSESNSLPVRQPQSPINQTNPALSQPPQSPTNQTNPVSSQLPQSPTNQTNPVPSQLPQSPTNQTNPVPSQPPQIPTNQPESEGQEERYPEAKAIEKARKIIRKEIIERIRERHQTERERDEED
jgi:serine/threonine protein kinase